MKTRWDQILADHQRIIVCGRSGAGKSSVARMTADRVKVWSTDYKKFGGDTPDDLNYVDTAYYWIDLLAKDDGPWLLEGTQASRVARAWLRERKGEPDAVVRVCGRYAPDELSVRELKGADDEEADKKRAAQMSRARSQRTVWADYLEWRDHFDAKSTLYEGHYQGEFAELSDDFDRENA